VQADDVFEVDRVPLGVGAVSVKVFDMAETVTAKSQLVRGDSKSHIANVESLLSVERLARI
jgi:hypothetical protein